MKRFFLLVTALALQGCSASPPPALTPAPPAPRVEAPATSTPSPKPQVSEKDFSIPFYPGATFVGGGVLKIDDRTIHSADLTTADPQEKVVDFYLQKMAKAQKSIQKEGNNITVTLTEGSTTVTVSKRASGVHINLVQ